VPSVRRRTSQSFGPLGSVKFVVDAQLPPALARVLRDGDCDAVAVREVGLRDATDADIWH
jgi:predicted nuclease of predicted toxin-antitoxin system